MLLLAATSTICTTVTALLRMCWPEDVFRSYHVPLSQCRYHGKEKRKYSSVEWEHTDRNNWLMRCDAMHLNIAPQISLIIVRRTKHIQSSLLSNQRVDVFE